MRSASPRMTKASATANSGARLPSVPVMTGPSARLAAKVRSVTVPGNIRPIAAKIGTAAHIGVASANANGATQMNSAVDDGMAIAAPESGAT